MSSAFPISGSRVANEQSNAFFIVWFFVFRGGGVMLVYGGRDGWGNQTSVSL